MDDVLAFRVWQYHGISRTMITILKRKAFMYVKKTG